MKRFLALLMTLMMLVSCLPAYAGAGLAPSASKAQICDHRWEVDPMGQQTCTEGCPAIRVCSICGKQESITLPALGHNWSDWYTLIEPTCLKDGKREHTCLRCRLTDSETLPKLGHDYAPWQVTKEPTCTEKGEKATRCRRCGQLWDEDLDPLGHDMGEWYRVKDPAPGVPGLEQRDCVRGDLTEQREIPYDGPVVTELVMTGSMGLPSPVLAADLDLVISATATNTGNVPLNSIKIYVTATDAGGNTSFFGLNDQLILDLSDDSVIASGEAVSSSVVALINEAYLNNGPCTFRFVATAMTPDGQLVTSNEWSCFPEAWLPQASIQVAVVDQPDTAPAVVGGEVPVTVSVTNVSDYDLYVGYMQASDSNGFLPVMTDYFPSQYIGGVDVHLFHPQETFNHTFLWDLTQIDVDMGQLVRRGWADARIWVEYNGEMYCVPSASCNQVSVVVPLTDNGQNTLTLYKEVISTPANPKGYVIGETITYRITVANNLDHELSNIEIFDPMFEWDPAGLVGVIETLGGGDTIAYTFDRTIYADDVTDNAVHNQAYAVMSPNGEEETIYSNQVISPVIVPDETPLLTLTGSMGLPNPVLAAGIYLPINLTATNEGGVMLNNIRIIGTARDDSGAYWDGGLYAGQLNDEAILDEPGSFILDLGDHVDASCSIYIYEMFTEDPQCTFTFVATATTPDGETVTSNEWSCRPEAYVLDVVYQLTAEDLPDHVLPEVGTVVPVTVRVTNTTEYDLWICDIAWSDDVLGDFDFHWLVNQVVDGVDLAQFHPGESFTDTIDIVITQNDIDSGMIVRNSYSTGRVWAEYNGGLYRAPYSLSNEEPIIIPIRDSGELFSVVKTVTSTPDDPLGYQEGEKVTFDITVTNNDTVAWTGIEVFDVLRMADFGYLQTIDLEPGASITVPYTYYVDYTDAAIAGHVSNQAYITYEKDGELGYVYSNVVTVPTFDGHPRPTLEKIETSTPADGGYYKLGEEIRYKLHLSNDTHRDYSFVSVVDCLSDMAPCYVGMVDDLGVGHSCDLFYSWIVTEADVARGRVENFFYAYETEASIYFSNVVTVFTSEGHPSLPNSPFVTTGEYHPCTLTLDDMGNEGAMYEQYICSVHQSCAARAAAATPAEARAIWKDALDEMYDAAYAAAGNDRLRAALLSEKAAFGGYLAAYEAGLKASGTDAATVDATICALIKRQCTDLCYMVYTAPEDRVDSYVGKAGLLTADATAVCGLDLYYTTDSDEYYMQNLCESHSKAQAAVLKSLAASDGVHTLNVWQQATRIWNAELKKLARPDAENDAFNAWLRSRSDLMLQVYDAETAAEMTALAIMDHVVDLCK